MPKCDKVRDIVDNRQQEIDFLLFIIWKHIEYGQEITVSIANQLSAILSHIAMSQFLVNHCDTKIDPINDQYGKGTIQQFRWEALSKDNNILYGFKITRQKALSFDNDLWRLESYLGKYEGMSKIIKKS